VVESVSGDVVVDKVSGPVERVWLEDSYHVATLDNDAPLIESRVVEFVGSVVGGRA
jgi:carboxylesterase